ncbi:MULTISPECIES: hypothetical protein [unclassified Roseitalea]|uniref:hypothetical protein n=1 Tax=unclassified Roseitalea TaxID=2639107 RepID=UPI00273D48CD|nr:MULTISPECIES: hypothetical protein [unclassified Roseitalea]
MAGRSETAAVRTAHLAEVVDALLPGDADFPSAAAIGVQWAVERRLVVMVGANGADRLLAAMDTAFAGAPDGESAARALEAAEPDLFAALLRVVYFTYYEHPSVIAAIRALGHDYNDAPQPKGYAMDPFNPATDLPARPTGSYVPTDQVRRVDLSGLDHLS